ncbi:MAG: NapC/NirT family cytochrome c [Actinomycetia bacterium]|nr:NapC/NirT family cytochrome c [Actinomycetes bacterium]
MEETKKAKENDLSEKKRKNITVLATFYAAVFLFIFGFGALLLTCQPFFCRSCHEMDPDIDSWASSSHAHVNCLSCHVESGWIHLLKDKMMAGKSMFYHFFPLYEKPINIKSHLSEEIHSENCMRCHSLVKVTPSEGILIDHEIHEEEGIKCSFCHNRVAHPGLAGYIDRSKMNACIKECHDGDKAKRDCLACHSEDFKLTPKDHDIKEEWKEEHGLLSKKDIKECESCHFSEEYCSDCHQMEMPHPSNWERNHKNEKELFGKCIICHTDPYFCENCHHPEYDPAIENWGKAHSGVVKEKGNTPCQDCHEISYCNACHRKQ